MAILVSAMFDFSLGEDAALILRTARIAEAYHELLLANQQRLARWEPWAADELDLAGTRASLEADQDAWLHGTGLPVAIVVPVGERWRLVGSAGLRINVHNRAANCGYWIDGEYEGRGLVTRTVTALLDQAFGPHDLARVALHADVANKRSRAVATRLGFTEEGIHREAIGFADERRDEVTYGLLAREWRARRDQ